MYCSVQAGNGGTGILGVEEGGREECVLTELNQLSVDNRHRGRGRVGDLGCRRSLSLGWVIIGDVHTLVTGNSIIDRHVH